MHHRMPFISTCLVLLFTAVGAVFAISTQAYAGSGNCRSASVVQAAAQDFMRAGRSGSPSRIRRALDRHVNMRRVMSFAMGRNIRKLRGKQRQNFYHRGSHYAARQLARLVRSVRGNKLEVLRCRGNHVETRLLPGGERIVWKVRGKRIVDVKFRGVSMVMLLRDHFRRLWRKAGNDSQAFLAQLN